MVYPYGIVGLSTSEKEAVEMTETCLYCAEDGIVRDADTALLLDGQRVPACDDCADHTYDTTPLDWVADAQGA